MYNGSYLEIDSRQEETVPFDTEGFPYIAHKTKLDIYPGQYVQWHWHKAIELIYIESGSIEYHSADGSCVLKQGDAGFVNAGALHMLKAFNGMEGCVADVQLFDMSFLSGQYGSSFEEKYFIPITGCQDIQIYPIYPDSRENNFLINCITGAFDLYEHPERFGYEFEIRSLLSRFWYRFFEITDEVRKKSSRKSDLSFERSRQMITYIKEHYSEKLELEDIAASASISIRECNRCFKKIFGMTPIEYLNEHRIRMSCTLLAQTPDSVSDISESCGFSSVSYFGRLFRDITGCTPREYRAKTADS